VGYGSGLCTSARHAGNGLIMAVTVQRARELIMSLEDTAAAPHVDREAFRAKGTQFASLRSDGVFNVKLSPEEQALRCGAAANVFKPVEGGWGRMGYTTISLQEADEIDIKSALLSAWTLSREKLLAPKKPPKPKKKPISKMDQPKISS
jgi:hypothetical protein